MIAWDTETRNLRWWENSAFLGSWDNGEGGKVAALSSNPDALRRALEADKHVVGANTKFDAHMTREAIGLDVMAKPGEYKVDDVLTMSRLVNGNRRQRHGLKELAVDYIDPGAAEAEKEMQDAYKELTGRTRMDYDDAFYVTWQARPDLVEKYAALDAEYTRKLYEILRPQIKADAKLESLYRLERRVQHVLYEAEKQGVHVDPEAVERLSVAYVDRDSEARMALEETLGFVPEGEGSVAELREALPRVGVELTETTETGELSVSRQALAKFADNPAVAALFEFRRVNKFLQTYIEPLSGTDHIHPTFNQSQAWTGRMSGSNPNMQNLPKRTEKQLDEDMRVRSVFVPRPGYEFIIADFDSIEMRILACYLGVPEYRELIANGDPHAITAAAAWGGAPESYYKGTDQRWLRDIAKQATYGIVYGGGGPVVRDTINKMVLDAGRPEYTVDLDQAKAIRKKITGAIPRFYDLTKSPYRGRSFPKGALYSQLERSAVPVGDRSYGYVRTLLGRKQWIALDRSYVALSGLIQGSAADVMKAAAVNLREALLPYGGQPILFVHDEAVCEVPAGWGERLKPVVVEAMESAVDINPSLKVEAHVTAKSYAHSD